VPPNVAAAVAKSLEKLPADRFASAAEFGAALTESGFAHRTATTAATAGTDSSRPRWLRPLHAAVTVVLLVALLWALSDTTDEATPLVMRTVLADSLSPITSLAVSPDGSRIVLSMTTGDGWQLFMRRVNELELRPISGTEGALFPQFSPDGQWVAFIRANFGGGSLLRSYQKIPVNGGPAVTILDSVTAADWGEDGSMAMSKLDGLYYLEAGTDSPRRVVERSEGMEPSRPALLPYGSGILFDTDQQGGGQVMLWHRGSNTLKLVAGEGHDAQYLPTGHVIYLTPEFDIFAMHYDIDRHEPSGAPVPLLEDVWAPTGATAALDFSNDGMLLYASARSFGEDERLVWVGMDGEAVDLPVRVDDFEDPRVSPDGRLLVYNDFVNGTVATYDLLTGANTVLPVAGYFAWAHDSRHVYVSSAYGLIRVPADGAEPIDTLSLVEVHPYSASADGSWLVAGVQRGDASFDLSNIPLDGVDHEPIPYLRAEWDEYQGVISPNGRWLAYISQETGESEVFVRSFPEPGRRMQASVGGGVGPVWAPDGGSVYFISNGSMVRGDFREGTNPGVTARTELFRVDDYEVSAGAFMEGVNARRRYDVHPDGTRFLMVRSTEELFAVRQPVIVVTNWFEELREKMGEP
jgi:serine/threonine-protein kinase